MNGKARIAVIGAGWWACHNYLPALVDHPEAEVVAVNRPDREALDRVTAHFGIAKGYTDHREMLAAERPDGVIVASPHTLHFTHAMAALEAGAHVLVDKPMTTSAADARALVAKAASVGREIVIPHGWNFKPYTTRAHELVAEGAIGRIEHVALQMASPLEDLLAGEPMVETADHLFRPPPSTWADPQQAGGYGWGQLSHALGLLFRVADLEPAQVFGTCVRSKAGVDYHLAGTVTFKGGATAAVSGTGSVPKHCRYQLDLRLFGTDGMLLLDVERERLEVRRRDRQDIVVPIEPGAGAYVCIEPVHRLVEICRGEAVRNEAPGTVGMRAVEVLDALYRSFASGKVEAV
jgi:predicted dehydrogenase